MLNKQLFIWVTRPEKQAYQTAKIFQQHGFKTIVDPILKVENLPLKEAELSDFDAFIGTSPNAIDAIAHIESLKNKTIFVVGPASKKMAITYGFTKIIQSDSGLNAKGLIKTIINCQQAKNQKILYLRGFDISLDVVSLLKAQGFYIEEKIVYKTDVIEPSSSTIKLLQDGRIGAITIFSLKTANFIKEFLEKHNLTKHISNVTALCLSNAIALKIASEWQKVIVAPTANDIAHLLKQNTKKAP